MAHCSSLRLYPLACAALGAFCFAGALAAQEPAQNRELEAAAAEFRTLTQEWGLRADSPKKTKSSGGSKSKFHGRLYENFRNDFLDAVPHEIVQRGTGKNLLRRNQFGFNISGPVLIPRIYDGSRNTFFSVTYEGVRERIARSYLRTVPIETQRRGDYNLVVDNAGEPLRIFDPASTRPNPNYDPAQAVSESNLQYLRDPFPGNVIPTVRQDPVARAALEYYPLPNSNAGPFFRNNYFIVSPETNKADGMIFKVDHSFLEKHRSAVTYSFTNGLAGTARFIPNAADSAVPDRSFQNRRLAVEHVFTVSPGSVNTASIDFRSDASNNETEGEGVPASLGLQGVPGQTFPYFDLGSYVSMGRANAISRNVRNTFIYSDSHALRLGRHNVRGTAQFIRTQVNTYVPQYPSGYFRFTPGMTSLPGIVNTGSGFANFLLGNSDYSEVSLVPSPSYFRGSRAVLAVQDNWEIRQGLNVSFGFNYEIFFPRTEKYDRHSTVRLDVPHPISGRNGALVFAGQDGFGRSFQPIAGRMQPNVSLAWNPLGNRKAVLRVAYSTNYQGIPLPGSQWGTQGFNGYNTFISPNVQLAPAVELSKGVPPPAYPLPDLRPEAADFTGADIVEPTARLPLYQYSGISYERELPGQYLVTAGYSHAWGKDLLVGNGAIALNAIHPDNLSYRDQLNNEEFRRTLRPYSRYQSLDVGGLWPGGKYSRDSFSLRGEKRTSQGLSLNLGYEFSKQFDDYSYTRQDYFNARNEWGLTAWNNPHRLSFNYMYELPIGSNKPYWNLQDWRKVLVDGWSVSGISSLVTGEPLVLRAQFNNTGGVLASVRVNQIPGIDPGVPNPGPDRWFNVAAFEHPPDFAMGTASRSHPTLRGPISQNHDLSLSKRFAIDAERTVEFNASAFNFINHANWNDPDTLIGNATTPNVNAGRIIGSRGGRVIQLGLRFSF